MARTRSGSGSGYAWALVVFGGGFFICLILAIVFYTKVDAATQGEESAKAALKRVGSEAEINNAVIAELDNGNTAVAKLLNEVQRLRTKSDGLEGQVSKLEGELKAAQDGMKQQEDATDRALASVTAEQAAKTKIQTDMLAQVSAMQTQIDGAQQLNQDLQTKIEAASKDMNASSKAQLAQLNKDLEDTRNTILENEREIEDLTRKLRIAENDADPTVGPPVTLADARIVSQIPDQNKVYLDLGAKDNLQLGMTFNLYDADAIIKTEDSTAVGKAIIEIIGLENASSVARIVEKDRLATINDGDIAVNLAFDPKRTLKFNIFGQYDLNNDGKLEEGDDDRVKQLVINSGGIVMDDLTFGTDFLVLGAEPPVPEEPADPQDLIAMRIFREASENYQNYQERIALAQTFKIPVLNQNRLLDLIGYYTK